MSLWAGKYGLYSCFERLWGAVLVDVGAALLVMANSLRCVCSKPSLLLSLHIITLSSGVDVGAALLVMANSLRRASSRGFH